MASLALFTKVKRDGGVSLDSANRINVGCRTSTLKIISFKAWLSMYSSEYLWNDLPCDQPTTSTSKEYIESIKDACGVSDFDACLIQEVNTSYELNTTAGTKAIYGSTTTQIVLSNHHACVIHDTNCLCEFRNGGAKLRILAWHMMEAKSQCSG
eukprot:509240_1